jgi:hypothetical protein
MRKQPNYTCMLKNLLKLYCIWTWDTLWGFFVCSTLCVPFDETMTGQQLRHHLQDWKVRWTPKLLRLKFHCIWTRRFFFSSIFSFSFISFNLYMYIFSLSFIYFLFLFLSLAFLFFIFNPLSVFLMPFQLMVDYYTVSPCLYLWNFYVCFFVLFFYYLIICSFFL